MRNIFVVGTGRSGTHLLCRTLLAHARAEDFLGGFEDAALLAAVSRAAIEGRPLGDATRATLAARDRIATAAGRVFVDQSHPLLWFVEQVAALLPESVFMFPWRPNEQVLASMLRHGGVLAWYGRVRSGEVQAAFPSRFLGIPSAAEIEALSLDELCLARVESHKRECLRLRKVLGPQRVRIVGYEDLVRRGPDAVAGLLAPDERRLLGPVVRACTPDVESLTKYAGDLTAAQIELARSREVPPA